MENTKVDKWILWLSVALCARFCSFRLQVGALESCKHALWSSVLIKLDFFFFWIKLDYLSLQVGLEDDVGETGGDTFRLSIRRCGPRFLEPASNFIS